VLGAAVVGLAWVLSPGTPKPGPSDDLPLLRQATFTGDVVRAAAIGGASSDSEVGLDMSGDGRTVVYLNRDRDRAMLIDLDGGGSRTLYQATDGTTLYDAAWSPDGDRVYLMTWPYAERVLSVPRLGGEPRPEFDLGKLAGLNGIFVRPLPDDRWAVFGNHNTMYVGSDPGLLSARGTQLDGDGVFRIEGLDLLHRVVVAASGRYFAFDGTDASGVRCAGVTDDTGTSRIVEAWSGLVPLNWTEEDRVLFLWRSVGPGVGDLLRVGMDPSTGRPTTDPVPVYPRLTARSLHVSSDGDRMLVRSGDGVVNVSVLELDATTDAADNPTRSLTQGTGRWAVQDILADGTVLASLSSDVRWELFSIAPDGTRRGLVRPEGFPTGVTATRDGNRIAITVERPENGLLIHDRTTNRNRTIPVPEPLSDADWSPDGRYLVGMTKNSADHVVVADVDRGEARRLALDCGDRCEFAYEGIRAGPRWPDFAVTSEVDVWVLNAETGTLRHVAENTWNILAWQDGSIYFTRGPGQTEWPGNVLFRVPAEGGAEQRLLDLPLNCGSLRIAPDGRTVACEMDESRLDLWVGDGLRGDPGT
jgi:Tol biopolymer transport system component